MRLPFGVGVALGVAFDLLGVGFLAGVGFGVGVGFLAAVSFGVGAGFAEVVVFSAAGAFLVVFTGLARVSMLDLWRLILEKQHDCDHGLDTYLGFLFRARASSPRFPGGTTPSCEI